MNGIDVMREARDRYLECLSTVDLDELSPADRFVVLVEWESALRQQIALSHAVISRLEQVEGCPPVPITLADALRISPREAKRRIRDAEQLAPRRTLTGEPLPPLLPETSKAWHEGRLDSEHLRVIQRFFRDLPDHVPLLEVEKAERSLADKSAVLRPDQLEKVAHRLALHLNPVGTFSDEDRARKRGFVWCGGQQLDGMSVGRVIADPELRSLIDAWMAKFAAPGMCNPADESPTTTPTDEVAERDSRSYGQRQHDALKALLRVSLGDPKFGQHNGLPVTVIVSATLQDIQARTGHGVTAAGTLLPISEVIRLGAHAYHYLALFDKVDGRGLWLGRTKRVASADQRIMLHSKERGCTRPGCDAPGYLTEVHHVDEWADGGLTNIDKLTLACRPDHRLLDQGWRTRKLANGDTEWIPPPELPMLHGGTNNDHHPEQLLGNDGDTPSEDTGDPAA
ncbi:maturase [Mycolicibacterium aromaticivorans JS19b1 = JCM 16368]|uniref:Maturase n=2 Tax=Mycolicibacterium aromaticivorans TaxID=318425 RepID=A0A064CFW1_9MYCO|nr:HNH endonuclease signature motif containing protein [Mycolicibacterium aromaticivorans]KDE97623.1 maturase [Mycolicibacterium aromaticivorans JS19b1 = JCM 16368]